MSSVYNYELYQRKVPDMPENLPTAPENTGVVIKNEEKSWIFSIPVGHPEAIVNEILEWIEETIIPFNPGGEIYDPQAGHNWMIGQDKIVLTEAIIRHNKWIMENIGTGDYIPPDTDEPGMPVRTKMIIWFAIILVGLYFLLNFALDMHLK
ncbi:hypothetical protein KKF34_03790 [Myxococcota bacterium]|nr:hypothetical protein [Myxococcota bacterium]MBU1381348.1 hypothetical protein [Myxococcota bacterium]MBU1495978.1 hypothetical protein [Myxococcota bacterium]